MCVLHNIACNYRGDIITQPCGICRPHYKTATWTPCHGRVGRGQGWVGSAMRIL